MRSARSYLNIICGFFLCLLVVNCTQKEQRIWHEESTYRWAELDMDFWGNTGFKIRSVPATNIDFQNRLTEDSIVKNRNLLNGSGVAAGDVTGDGFPDLYFAQLDGPNRLYRNLGGFAFKDITDSAGVAHSGFYSTGTVMADVDGDGDLDLLVASMSKENILYINDGKGRFNKKESSGLGKSNGTTTMTLADIDQDKDLDLYTANYKSFTVKDRFDIRILNTRYIVERHNGSYRIRTKFQPYFKLFVHQDRPDIREWGAEDALYLNDGKGYFEKIDNDEKHFLDQQGSPLGLQKDWGLTATFRDLNRDNLPDLYVANDFWSPDRVWINQGKGIFQLIDSLAIRKFSYSSMGVDVADINRDGYFDLFVTEMLSPVHYSRVQQLSLQSPLDHLSNTIFHQPQYPHNTLQLNRGDGTYAEISGYSNVKATGWSWATRFMDIDLDGYEDLIIATGNGYDLQNMDAQQAISRELGRPGSVSKGYILKFPQLPLQNIIFRNKGNLKFMQTGPEWGFNEKDISHGLATADFDLDGDLDIVFNRLNKRAAIFENTSDEPRIAVKLRGNPPNTKGIGANVKLVCKEQVQQKEMTSGGDYASGSEPLIVFGMPECKGPYTLRVSWPGGVEIETTITDVMANRIYEVFEKGKLKIKSLAL